MINLNDPTLQLLSDSLDDLEAVRTATSNRLNAMTRSTEDKDGEIRGHGLTLADPEVIQAAQLLAGIEAFEHEQVKQLVKRVKSGPFAPFIKSVRGLGEKQAARLISVIGDPYLRPVHERDSNGKVISTEMVPRTVSQLWAYCGYAVHDGVPQRRRKGERSNWNTKAKSRAFLIGESILKSQVRKIDKTIDDSDAKEYLVENRTSDGHYGALYLASRAADKTAVHDRECVRCGPSGKPAQPGSPLSLKHQHARAVRRVAKELLKDLWAEARQLHMAAS